MTYLLGARAAVPRRGTAVLRPIILPLMTRFHTACRAAGVEVDGLSAEELEVLAGGRGAAS
jgi:hypothetical protein